MSRPSGRDASADRWIQAKIGRLLGEAIERLKASGSESARLDAELLLGHVLGVGRTTVLAHPEAPVGAESEAAFEAALVRREAGEPVAYIRGLKEFHGLALMVDARALIPRPETEALVDEAIREIAARLTRDARPLGAAPIRVADVGTGSGAIAVALAVALRERRMLDGLVEIVATDRSAGALQLARENAVGHGVADAMSFVEADLLPDVLPEGEAGAAGGGEGAFELVLANLPYVPSDEVGRLPIAASFEPRAALDGGEDGLEVVGRLIGRLPCALREGGAALLEIGADQALAVTSLAASLGSDSDVSAPSAGWTTRIVPDLAGRPRVVRIVRTSAGRAEGATVGPPANGRSSTPSAIGATSTRPARPSAS